MWGAGVTFVKGFPKIYCSINFMGTQLNGLIDCFSTNFIG